MFLLLLSSVEDKLPAWALLMAGMGEQDVWDMEVMTWMIFDLRAFSSSRPQLLLLLCG